MTQKKTRSNVNVYEDHLHVPNDQTNAHAARLRNIKRSHPEIPSRSWEGFWTTPPWSGATQPMKLTAKKHRKRGQKKTDRLPNHPFSKGKNVSCKKSKSIHSSWLWLPHPDDEGFPGDAFLRSEGYCGSLFVKDWGWAWGPFWLQKIQWFLGFFFVRQYLVMLCRLMLFRGVTRKFLIRKGWFYSPQTNPVAQRKHRKTLFKERI